MEIAAAVAEVFGPRGVGRAEILAEATSRHSRPALIATLSAIPDRRYIRLNELWHHLDEVPLGG
jgi:hypothetical protein